MSRTHGLALFRTLTIMVICTKNFFTNMARKIVKLTERQLKVFWHVGGPQSLEHACRQIMDIVNP